MAAFSKSPTPKTSSPSTARFSLLAFIWPTMPQRGSRQTILGRWDTLTQHGLCTRHQSSGTSRILGRRRQGSRLCHRRTAVARARSGTSSASPTIRETGRAELYQEGVLNRYNSLVGKVVPYEFASHVVQQFRFMPENNGRLAVPDRRRARRARFARSLRQRPVCRQNRPAGHLPPRADAEPNSTSCRTGALPPAEIGRSPIGTPRRDYTEHGIGHEVVDTGAARAPRQGRQSSGARHDGLELERQGRLLPPRPVAIRRHRIPPRLR